MPLPRTRGFLLIEYERAALEYSRKLKDEDLMEATSQATQRKITVESMDLVHAVRPDVQTFNELLIQYEPRIESKRKKRRLGQVVPDNMIVVWPEPIKADASFNLPLQPIGPLCVLEYVSKSSEQKDFEISFAKYEQDLKVPYFLLFYPESQELSLYHHNGERYISVLPNEHGRCPIPEIEVELALLDGWLRYWFRGELLPLPADLQRDLIEAKQQLKEARQQVKQATERLEDERKARLAVEQELERLRAQLETARKQP